MVELTDEGKRFVTGLRAVTPADLQNDIRGLIQDTNVKWNRRRWKKSYRLGRVDTLEEVLDILNRQT